MSENASTVDVRPSPPPLRVGIWWFLASEVAVFGGAVVCFVLFRLRHPEWVEEAHHLLLFAGVVNTLVLLTSSLTMVFAHEASDRRDEASTTSFLFYTLLLGILFLGIKAYEYGTKWGGGYTISKSLFFAFYYLLTGLHALHVAAGLVAIFVILLYTRRGRALERVEGVALYWHFVDIVWIFLFPLLYVISGKG